MNAVPHPILSPITPLPATGAGEALHILEIARGMCISASYHPLGGDACHAYIPVSHTVWCVASREQISELKAQLENTQ